MSPVSRHLLRLAVLAAAFAALVPATALGATAKASEAPCWKLLLNDWYDGTINKVYPIPCYQSAIKHLPTDLVIYSSAKEDIQAAEQAAINHKPIPAEQNKPTTTTTTTTGKKSHGLRRVIKEITPGNPESFPLPLLILGAVAILLLIAGGVGMLWQRSNPRDEPPGPA